MATKRADEADRRPSFRNLMMFRLHMVARLSERISEDHYRRHLGLSLPECRVIGITASYGSVSFKQLVADANLEKSYASRVVSALVERGLMEKRANPSDSRSVLLHLTGKGRAMHEQTHALALSLDGRLQTPFTRSQIDDFMAFLAILQQQLTRADGAIGEAWPGKGPASPLLTAVGRGQAHGSDVPALDHDFARRLRDMLDQYLEGRA